MPDLAEIAAFRFGYGLSNGGLPVGARDANALMAQITGEDRGAALWPSYGVAEVIPVMLALREARGMDKAAKGAKKAQRRAVKAGKALAVLGSKAAMARAVSGDGFRERLVRFWADHFTTVPKGRTQFAWPSAMETDAIRPHVAGRFVDMLAAVITHPAMLLYLDQAAAQGPGSKRGAKKGKGLNENLAREVLELHTLGVGADYGQEDVRQLAELFTGLTVTPAKGFAFDEGRAEPGAEVVLGVEYGGEGVEPVLAALQDLAVRPETARHVAGKLAVHFVSDTPDPGLVQAMAAVWQATGGDLAAVTQAMLDHPAAWAERFEKARQPHDFMAASLRALGLTGDQIMAMKDGVYLRMIQDPMKVMGQHWNHAPGPDGWPEGFADWITPQGMAARIDWAMATPGLLVTPLLEAADVARAALGSRLTGALDWAIGAAESRREALGLVFASPEFNRR
jgi:uncharacterized protein (DUF1800 family)